MNLLGKRKQEVGPAIGAGDLTEYSLEQLFDEAEQYGRVDLEQAHDLDWRATIKFQTVPGATLWAQSAWNCKSKGQALRQAIRKAKEIKAQFK